MKFARFRVDGYDYYGQVEADRLRAIQGDLFSGDYRLTGAVFALDRVTLLPPSRPVNFWGVGENYPVHVRFRIEQMGREIEERAKHFTPWHKGVGSLIASGDTVVMPPDLKVLEYEGELCVVIGRPAYRVSRDEAPHYIFGYSVSNDISGADYHDAFMWRMKCSDTFGPVGPWIETTIDPHSLDIITRVDGREEDRGNTRDMIHDCYAIVSNISQYCTLHPGDLITTGAPGSTRPLKPGEVVEVEIPGIGVLRNPIAAARSATA